jgi:16S rRNA (cytosine967-C5)-methyltransferase
VTVLAGILDRGQRLDEAFEKALIRFGGELPPRDRAFARLLATTTLRRLGEIDAALAGLIERPLPREAHVVQHVLRITAAQLVFLATPAHAAVDSAVRLVRQDERLARLAGLVNAVARRLASVPRVPEAAAGQVDTPDWLWQRWLRTYGPADAQLIAGAHLVEPALDLSVKSDAEGWAARLGGEVLKTGSVRLQSAGRIEALDGFEAGAWWVQDAAAALPVKLLGPVAGLEVADLCAAPGGKTAGLAAAGARVVAVDSSERRLRQAGRNLARLGLPAELVAADLRTWAPGRTFERILLDAPCLATGTIRRHPDLPYLKSAAELESLLPRQQELLASAARLLAPGGTLVYAVCSLEPEEGEGQIGPLLASRPDLTVSPVAPGEGGIAAEWITPQGYLRTLPFHSPGRSPNVAGMDGFFAARLTRQR